MISKERAKVIRDAYIKHKGWYGHLEARHNVELNCFMDGMRAMAKEWLHATKCLEAKQAAQELQQRIEVYEPHMQDDVGPF